MRSIRNYQKQLDDSGEPEQSRRSKIGRNGKSRARPTSGRRGEKPTESCGTPACPPERNRRLHRPPRRNRVPLRSTLRRSEARPRHRALHSRKPLAAPRPFSRKRPAANPKQPANRSAAGHFVNHHPRQPVQSGRSKHRQDERLKFDPLNPSGLYLQAAGEYTEKAASPSGVAVCIGPEYGTVGPDSSRKPPRKLFRGSASTC